MSKKIKIIVEERIVKRHTCFGSYYIVKSKYEGWGEKPSKEINALRVHNLFYSVESMFIFSLRKQSVKMVLERKKNIELTFFLFFTFLKDSVDSRDWLKRSFGRKNGKAKVKSIV